MKFVFQILLFISCISGYSQKLIVDNKIKTIAPKVQFSNDDKNLKINCIDIIKSDTITLSMGKGRFEIYHLDLIMVGDQVVPKMYYWADYPMFDGKSSIELTISDYRLELNKKSYVAGDTIMGSFSITTVPNKYQKKMRIKGDVFHVIGGNYFTWNGSTSTHNKYFHNGKNVFVKSDD